MNARRAPSAVTPAANRNEAPALPTGPMLSVAQLEDLIAAGEIETILVVAPDGLGRLTGKRFTGRAFLDHIVDRGAPICEYVLDRNVEMEPALAAWGRGFGDWLLRPDLSTLRRAGWLEQSAVVICDFVDTEGRLVEIAPRQILRRQLERVTERGWIAHAATELEFILFRTSLEDARARGYRQLRPATEYNADFTTLAPTMMQDVITPLIASLSRTGITVEDWKGEAHPGQVELNLPYAEAMRMADDHILYKEAAKIVAWRNGCSLTFMPKFSDRPGNSCHIHYSLADSTATLFERADGERGAVFRSFLAGQLRYSRELCYLFAQNVNSYKRFAEKTFAPVGVVWGEDNRTCGLRVVGEGEALRIETRIPGGDCNPYLAFAAITAMGLRGIDAGLKLEPAFVGDAYTLGDGSRLPYNLGDSLRLFEGSDFARQAFGDEVVEHYLQSGWDEQRAYDAAVTDWDLCRSFERT